MFTHRHTSLPSRPTRCPRITPTRSPGWYAGMSTNPPNPTERCSRSPTHAHTNPHKGTQCRPRCRRRVRPAPATTSCAGPAFVYAASTPDSAQVASSRLPAVVDGRACAPRRHHLVCISSVLRRSRAGWDQLQLKARVGVRRAHAS